MMLPEVERWSPEEELRLLEELGEAQAQAFDLDLEVPAPAFAPDAKGAWVAYWYLPPNGIGSKSRAHSRTVRGR
jgi:hypothetical protein